MKSIVFVLMILFLNQLMEAQESNPDRLLLGIWDREMNFLGIGSIDSSLFDLRTCETRHQEKIDLIYTQVKKFNTIWFYILVSKDTTEIYRVNEEMKVLISTNQNKEFVFSIADVVGYFVDDSSEVESREILPDGHWLCFKAKNDMIGIYGEKFIYKQKLINYIKFYDEDSNRLTYYLEFKNGIADGINASGVCDPIDSYDKSKLNRCRVKKNNIIFVVD